MTNKIAIEYLKDMLASAEANLHVPDMAEHAEALDMAIEALSKQPEIIQCKDCYWWEKQEASMQGRCDRYGFYPTGYWYCAGARERKDNELRVGYERRE